MEASAVPGRRTETWPWWRFPGAGMLLVLAIVVIVVGVLEPRFLTERNLTAVLRQAAPLAIAAYGMGIVIFTGSIDLSTGAVVAMVSMLGVLAGQAAGSAPVGWLAGVLVGLAFGIINGFMVAYLKIPPFIATFGTLTYGHGLALAVGGGQSIEFPPAGYNFLGQGSLASVPIPFVAALVLLVLSHLFMTRTTLGRQILMIGGNRRAAELSGVDVRRVQALAYVIAGLLAGVAGVILSSRVNSGQPELAPTLQFDAIAAVAVGGVSMRGGKGTVFQVFVGALLLSVVKNALNIVNVSTYWQMVAVGVVTVAALVAGGEQEGRAYGMWRRVGRQLWSRRRQAAGAGAEGGA
ncbi:MAG TPA: ABC transporter permease [Limnochordales bacterium]|nr:ABC transporter permease [Limnochordales bacterium]